MQRLSVGDRSATNLAVVTRSRPFTMTNNNTAWRNSRQHRPSDEAVRKATVQPITKKKIDVDITFYQFQRYLELLKLTNSQFRLKAPNVGPDSDDSGVDEAMSGDERETERASHHAFVSTSLVNISSNHTTEQPQQVQSNHHGSVTREHSWNAKVSLVRCRENEHGYPYHAGASWVRTKESVMEKQCRMMSNISKDAYAANSSRMCRQNVAEHGDKMHPTMGTPCNNPWETDVIDQSRCHRRRMPSTGRPDGFNTYLPSLSRDTTLTSRRDKQDSVNTLTTPVGSRTNKLNVRFGDVPSASTSVNDDPIRHSKRVVGNSSTSRSSSSGSVKGSAPTARRRPFPSVTQYPKSESKRWVFTSQPTALRLYVSYYEPPAQKFVDGITASDGTPLLPYSRQHILRGMVYNRHTKSIHPPLTRSMKRGVDLVRKVGRTTRCNRAKTVARNVTRSVPDDQLGQSTFQRMVSMTNVFSLK